MTQSEKACARKEEIKAIISAHTHLIVLTSKTKPSDVPLAVYNMEASINSLLNDFCNDFGPIPPKPVVDGKIYYQFAT